MREKAVSVIVLTLLLVGMLSLAFDVGWAQPPATEWTKTYGGTSWDVAWSVVETSDGGYALAGYTWSFGAGRWDFWLVKTDSSGTKQWDRTYGGADNDYAHSVVETSDGGYAIAGDTESYGAGMGDFWLVKTDSAGNHEWNQTYGGAYDEWFPSIVETSDGGYALAGETQSFGAGGWDFWLVKTDSSGTKQWDRTYGGTSGDEAWSVVETSDGGYALAGETKTFGAGGGDFWLVKTDSAGNHEWNRTYGGTSWDVAYSVVETSDGGYALAGYTRSFGADSGNFWLVKTDSAGNHEWNQTYGGAERDMAWSVAKTFDGGYAIAGITLSFGAGGWDFWLVKTDSAGNHEWNQTYGGTGFEFAYSVVETSDGGYAIAGSTASFGAGSDDFWLVKVAGPPRYNLTISSSPNEITFTVSGTPHTTPYLQTYFEGTSVNLEMPATHGGYVWDYWSDMETNRTKTVIMNADIILTAVYAQIPKPVGGKATPIVISANKLELLAPYLELTILLAVAVATVVYVKKRKAS